LWNNEQPQHKQWPGIKIEELTPKGRQGKGKVDLERASQLSNPAQMIVLPGAHDIIFYSLVGMSKMDQTF